MSNFLYKIQSLTEARVNEAKVALPHSVLKERMQHKPRNFLELLVAGGQPRVIAEVKRQSPSLGAIALTLDPVAVAQEYMVSGAAAISVLTEPNYFGGSIETLADIREALPAMPLLMKDFVIDPYQLLQARVAGADAVLLIQALLGEAKLNELLLTTAELGLTALVEVHDALEMKSAIRSGAKLIGINNRNLRTLDVSLSVSKDLAQFVTPGVTLVSESGIESESQIKELMQIGFDAFLIGSALMKSQQPGRSLKRILGRAV
ncbi:MAG: indole-3-glycerol phosphate synthase TrpC [Deltaproteobacteria bacterium]|nr:indole-3-glycerol phosphate synthase TrpC [Deltaproteobacteria bacterium]